MKMVRPAYTPDTGVRRRSAYPAPATQVANGSLADRVAVYTRHLILTGVLTPGTHIDQQAICDALGVSRSPIREALVVLGQEGLVDVNHHRGAFVAEITPDDIADHYELFGAVSGRAAAMAAELLTQTDLDDLAAVHQRFVTGDLAERSLANHQFHRIINKVAPTRTRWLLALLERSVPADYYEFSNGLYAEAAADHERIIEALNRRDPGAARRAMEHHLREGGRAATEALRRQNFWN